MKCTEGSKENYWDLGSVGVYVNFRALEKSIWVLEKSWKFVSEKGYEPWYMLFAGWEVYIVKNSE